MQHFLRGTIFFTTLIVCSPKEVWCDSNNLSFERKELLKVAYSLEKSLNELRTLEKAKAAQSSLAGMQSRKPPKGGAMEQIVTIQSWEGPLEGLLKVIAEKYRYALNIIGRKPTLPILVSISAENKTVGTVLQDADLQAGIRAHISVDHSVKPTIELRYV